MNFFRRHSVILLILGLILPLGIAFLNYLYYEDNDIIKDRQISMPCDESFLSLLKNNPKSFSSVTLSFQLTIDNLLDAKFFPDMVPDSSIQSSSVLRC